MNTVPDMLRVAAKIYEDRNKMYGDNYKRFGPALSGLMNGAALTTPDDFNRFGILVQIFSKISRYCNMFEKGGHDDTLDDIAVYAMMLKEIDSGARVNTITSEIGAAIMPKISLFGTNPELLKQADDK